MQGRRGVVSWDTMGFHVIYMSSICVELQFQGISNEVKREYLDDINGSLNPIGLSTKSSGSGIMIER